MKNVILTSIFICALYSFTNAQSLQGTITNQHNKPLEGAHILILSSGKHVHSDLNGRFEIKEIRIGDSLKISHVGFETTFRKVEQLDESLTIKLVEKSISLSEIVISPGLDAVILFAEVNIQTNPVNSSQELLRNVPGLIIGQHAGGGKAEQIFLRGFDIDHGTDINITVDGMPVNMVSHAHGQGYADLHFLIPETIEKIDFGKGPYYADKGNFTTAGYVNFKTKETLDQSQIKLEAGQFNTQRLLGMFNLLNENDEHSAYIASEYLLTDGPFDSPQNFSRINLMGKYTGQINQNDKLSVMASYFTSEWDASGQIPQRAVDNGMISRFGAIDDTEGGNTSRTNVVFDYTKTLTTNSFIKSTAYYAQYDFELYSNFTFFLDDQVNGDQIKQIESRQLFGLKSEYNQQLNLGNTRGSLQLGVGLRNDLSNNNELSHTANRITTLDTLKLGDINETNFFGYINTNFELGQWLINPSIRIDQFKFNYYDRLLSSYETQAETKAIVSPKLNILYNFSNKLQVYLKSGKGFHSNDTRVVVAQNGKEILPAAYGSDLGFIWKPFPNTIVNTAYWYLFLEQEFVYVGDAGIVEPSGKTRRTGFDFSLRYQPLSWLFMDADANYTLSRATEEPEGNDFVPLAPDFTLTGGINFIHPDGIYGGARVRHIANRPANEDNSIVAEGYTIVDLNAGYNWNNLGFSIAIQNLLNTEWNETQFATESRLQDEPEPVEEIHFTPGTPISFKGTVSYSF